jgi:hypothetical protein
MDEAKPVGKRKIRITVRGTVVGYIGRTPWECFGERSDPSAHERAAEWLAEA